MIDIVPISIPTLDWDGYINTLWLWLGRPVTAGLDKAEYVNKDFKSFITTLHDLSIKEGVSPTEAMKFARSTLDHLHFSFLVRCTSDQLIELLQEAEATVAVSQSVGLVKVAVVTASLKGWRDAILIYLASPHAASTDVRRFYDALVLFFESMGLGELWQNRQKRGLPDKTFLLSN